jgi:hypothetical protein
MQSIEVFYKEFGAYGYQTGFDGLQKSSEISSLDVLSRKS